MSKKANRAQSKHEAGQQEKISLKKCLTIFNGIRLPWVMMVLSLILLVVSAFASMKAASFSGDMVDASGTLPVRDLVIYIVSVALQITLSTATVVIQGLASERMNLGLRQKLWNKIIFTKQSAYDKDGGEELVSRVTTDCDFACQFFTATVTIISTIATSVMYLTQLYRINTGMANWTLAFVPVSFILGVIYSMYTFKVTNRQQNKLASSTAYLVERTKDMPLIKTSCAEQTEIADGKVCFDEQCDAQIRMGYATALQKTIDQALGVLATALPFILGAGLVASGTLTVGSVVIFNGIFGSLKTAFSNLILNAGNVKAANGALARISTVFDLPNEEPGEGAALPEDTEGSLVFEDVSFAYKQGDRNVLNHINCSIPKGKITAVIGTNGSGKSTLFKLADRLYEPTEGQITLGGKDAASYSLGSWRAAFNLVPQDSPMMAGTLRENICYGRNESTSDEELMRVAKLTHVWDFAKDLPEGFDTEVLSGGSNFSGGQRQCIALARAMLNPGRCLLMDESTSALDADKEQDAVEAMFDFAKGKTTLIIAHSLAAICHADYVLVIHEGEVESFGTPQEILTKTGNYLNTMMNRTARTNA